MAKEDKESKVKKLKNKKGKILHISAQLLATLTEEDKEELRGMVDGVGDESFERYIKDSERLMPKKKVMPPITWRNK